MGFRQTLLGLMPMQQNQMQSLLGAENYNPKGAAWNAFGGLLEGAGVGLMTGDWARGLEASQAADDRYQRQALLGYKVGQDQQDQAWQNKAHARQEQEWTQEDATNKQVSSMLGGISDPGQRMWAQMDPKGYLSNKYGQHESKAPASVQEYQYAQQNGYKGSYTDFKQMGRGGGMSLGVDPETGALTIMAGGGGSGGGGGLPAEVGARMGLGQQFIKTDVPTIEPMIKNGDATGPVDFVSGVFGRGNAGEVHRRMATGADALRRGLTGAGMGQSEANDYANRYLPVWSDDASTLEAKEKSLVADLNAVSNGALAGKTGNFSAFLPGSKAFSPSTQGSTQPPPAQSQPQNTVAASGPKEGDQFENPADIPEGAIVVDEAGIGYRKVNGQLVKVQ